LTILNHNVSQDSLKVQIIEQVLKSLHDATENLSKDDLKSLYDHLYRQAGQLLRKPERCLILLKICEQCGDGLIDSNNIDQICTLLMQIPSNDPIKFDLALRFLAIVLRTRSLSGKEEEIFDWVQEVVSQDSSREIEFLSIKMKRDEYSAHVVEFDDEAISIEESVNSNSVKDHQSEESEIVHELNQDDLQKLKIFESFHL
jgi:hypothetical protein